MPAERIIQLRQLLTEKFPGSRVRSNGAFPSAERRPGDPPGDEPPAWHRFPTGALTEIVAAAPGSGSVLLVEEMVARALREKKLVALVDGRDSFDVTRFEGDLSGLLWVRCRSAAEALKAADLLLRDRNLNLVVLDLAANPEAQLRKVQPTTWYRFQRLLEQTSAVCVVLTSRAMVSPARMRMILSGRNSLPALERFREELLAELRLRLSETRRANPVPESLQNTA